MPDTCGAARACEWEPSQSCLTCQPGFVHRMLDADDCTGYCEPLGVGSPALAVREEAGLPGIPAPKLGLFSTETTYVDHVEVWARQRPGTALCPPGSSGSAGTSPRTRLAWSRSLCCRPR